MGRRRLLLTLGVALLAMTAGCNSDGPTDSPTASDGTPATTATAQTETGTGTGNTTDQTTSTANQPTLDRVTGNQTAALQQLDSFTIEATSRFSNDSTTITTTRTVRVDTTTDEVLADTQVTTGDTSLRETSYSTGGVAYTRTQFANTSFYERQSVEALLANVTNSSRRGSLGEQFAFDHTRTADGDHRFTADSVDQYRGAAPQDGTIENVSALVRVDEETSLVTTTRINLVVRTDEQRISTTQTLEVTARGETAVPEPDWLDTAKDRTE